MKPKKRSKSNSFYSYSAKRSLRQEEIAAYRRIALATLIVVALIVGGYFLGVPLLANLGNTNSNLNQQLGTADNVAPAPPILNSVPNQTNQQPLRLTGSAESGATISVMINGEEKLSTIVDGQGLFEGEVELANGQNAMIATARDAAGNTSRESKEVIVVYDATPPSLVLLQNIPDTTDEATLTVSGKTEPGAKVAVNQRRSIVNSEGVFNSTINLEEGQNSIEIISTDAAGNENVIKRNITRSTSPPPDDEDESEN